MARREGLSVGCVLVLTPVLLGLGLVALVVLNLVWSVVQMNLHRDDFEAFNHVDAGTPARDVVDRARDLGFDEFSVQNSLERDSGIESRSFMKTVVPPFGRWFVHLESFDGRGARHHQHPRLTR
jgi:hypothetical protein